MANAMSSCTTKPASVGSFVIRSTQAGGLCVPPGVSRSAILSERNAVGSGELAGLEHPDVAVAVEVAGLRR